MGVCLVSYAVSDANIEAAIADPPLVWRIVESEDETSYLRELARAAKVPLLSRLLGKTRPAPEVRNLSFTGHELRFVDLDKSWDGLRACLEVCAPQAPDFFEGSGQVGKIEVGYGPALYLHSPEVHRIAQAYADVTETQILEAFAAIELKGLYPKGLWRRGDAEVRSYLTENFAQLQAFVQYASQHALGAIHQFT
jgi:hypothetical protein